MGKSHVTLSISPSGEKVHGYLSHFLRPHLIERERQNIPDWGIKDITVWRPQSGVKSHLAG